MRTASPAFPQSVHSHRMKVLIKLFQKFAQVEGAKPSSRPQARNSLSPFFNLRSKYVLLSCGYIAKKKNGENYLNVKRKRKLLMQSSFLFVYVRKSFPFFLSKELQKEPKTAYEKFRLCGGDEGCAPSTAPPFEKGGRKLFMSWLVRVG